MPRVIIIEDHDLVRRSQRMLLEQAGYEVLDIKTSADLATLDMLRVERDVIIADFDLGGALTGIDIALQIMRNTGRRIPTLVLSGTEGRCAHDAAQAARMPVMAKPASEEALMAWIANAFADDTSSEES